MLVNINIFTKIAASSFLWVCLCIFWMGVRIRLFFFFFFCHNNHLCCVINTLCSTLFLISASLILLLTGTAKMVSKTSFWVLNFFSKDRHKNRHCHSTPKRKKTTEWHFSKAHTVTQLERVQAKEEKEKWVCLQSRAL